MLKSTVAQRSFALPRSVFYVALMVMCNLEHRSLQLETGLRMFSGMLTMMRCVPTEVVAQTAYSYVEARSEEIQHMVPVSLSLLSLGRLL